MPAAVGASAALDGVERRDSNSSSSNNNSDMKAGGSLGVEEEGEAEVLGTPATAQSGGGKRCCSICLSPLVKKKTGGKPEEVYTVQQCRVSTDFKVLLLCAT